MANQRAQLIAHELEEAHVPLSMSKEHRTLAVASDGQNEGGFKYPDLVRGQKDPMVSKSFRIPYSQVQKLDELQREKGVVPSELVRRLLAEFLATLG